MERFYKRILELPHPREENIGSSKRSCIEINMADLPSDPGLRAPILDYDPNVQDEIRRHYLQQGPCQPKDHEFPYSLFGNEQRRFNPAWFDKFSNWLEYSIDKDSAFCLCCYLFKPNIGEQAGGKSFVGKGFNNWKKSERLGQHVGNHNEEIRVVALKNAPETLRMTSPKIQKDIVNACAVETINVVIKEIGDAVFSILVDESRDVSIKEQMVVMFRYVDKRGNVIERFIGIEHVANTTAIWLKIAIDKLFSKHGLSISRLRGQGYDGASNMSGEFNGLKTIIMRENECAFFVHCFAHQLQLALMGVAKKHGVIGTFFTVVSNVVNIVGASSKRRDILREKHALKVIEALKSGDLSSGKGLNQEIGIKRPCDTRWGTHFGTLVSFTTMFSSIIDVLEEIANDRLNSEQKTEASISLRLVQTYDIVFSLHLMKTILGITNELSQVLQKDDQDIVNAMDLVKVCKQQLQMMRDNGWNSLLEEVSSFCVEQNIDVLNMDDMYYAPGKSRRKAPNLTNMHYYHVDFFNAVIDLQLQELNNRFNEANTELLLCLACLSPNDSFSAFDKRKLIRLAQLYSHDFSSMDLRVLESQLQTYVNDMRSNAWFSELKGIAELAKRLVETRKHEVYPLVYLLIKLALTLPVATASVERAFSAMNIVKNQMRNKMGDQWLNDCLTVYLEKDVFNAIDNEPIIQCFQNMKSRRGQL